MSQAAAARGLQSVRVMTEALRLAAHKRLELGR
jgi:hypothetical protein